LLDVVFFVAQTSGSAQRDSGEKYNWVRFHCPFAPRGQFYHGAKTEKGRPVRGDPIATSQVKRYLLQAMHKPLARENTSAFHTTHRPPESRDEAVELRHEHFEGAKETVYCRNRKNQLSYEAAERHKNQFAIVDGRADSLRIGHACSPAKGIHPNLRKFGRCRGQSPCRAV
jgi:hypothetical protein